MQGIPLDFSESLKKCYDVESFSISEISAFYININIIKTLTKEE